MGSRKDRQAASLRERVRQLEEALAAKESENDRLRGRVEDQQSALAEKAGYIQKLMKERDDLRQQNAHLTHRLSDLVRKHSFKHNPTVRRATSTPYGLTVNFTPSELGALPSSPPTSTSPTPTSSPTHLSPTTSPTPTSSPSTPAFFPLSPTPESPAVSRSQSPLPSNNNTLRPPQPKGTQADGSADDTDYSDLEQDLADLTREAAKETPSSQPHPLPSQKETNRSNSVVSVTDIQLLVDEREKNQGAGSLPTVPVSPLRQPLPDSEEPRISTSSSASSGYGTQTSVKQDSVSSPGATSNVSFESEASSSFEKPLLQKCSTMPCLSPGGLKKSRSQESLDMLREEAEEEEEVDQIGAMKDFGAKKNMIRQRTATVSAFGKNNQRGVGRKNPRQLKKEAEKLMKQNSLEARRGKRRIVHNLELFSPDMEAKIHEKICSGIGKKYGGLEKVTKAAVTIQRAYRQYKMRKHFEGLRKEASQMRKRAMTVGGRGRKQSIIRRRYHRELSSPGGIDPLAHVKERAKQIGQERPMKGRAHNIRLQREKSCDIEAEAGQPLTPVSDSKIALEFSPTPGPVLAEFKLTISGVCEDESSTDEVHVKPDGGDSVDEGGVLPTSFSSDQLLTGSGYTRPLSVFSVRSATSLQEMSEGEAGQVGMLPGQHDYSKEVLERKKNIGINHFNRKPIRGIQYLVLEGVVEDSPQAVASFIHKEYGLSKEKIGEFLGEINEEFNIAVLECITEQVEVGDKPIDEALRHFQQIFRMPGEAQKIDKIMQVFAVEFFRHNKASVIKSEDAAYILSFAIMMLHTSLHNPSVRNRTTRKQWISMNRGVNEGENFPNAFLMEIYDRIQKTEFSTGQDHTQEVAELESSIVNSTLPRLAIPQRRFILRVTVTEVADLNSRITMRSRHKRTLLVFSDLVIVCKSKGASLLQYKDSFSLLHAIAVSFETTHFKNGVQIYSSLDRKAIFQCNCESRQQRQDLLARLEDSINEMQLMEKERMAELGTTLGQTKKSMESSGRRGGAGDIEESTMRRSTSLENIRQEKNEELVTSMPGVGEIAVTSTLNRGFLRRPHSKSESKKRSSGDSGIGSQVATPNMSPSPIDTATKTHEGLAGTSNSAPHSRSATMPQSRSNHELKSMMVIPSAVTPPRSPSADSIERRSSAGVVETSISRNKRDRKSKGKRFGTLTSPFKRDRSRSPVPSFSKYEMHDD